ncbi:hypothetical protein EDD71_101221 [Fonticella tunisiensis]|uniref:Uncharacterized protein n=1 Tax=Fonticella tunisiensis TaxID=1096341 RepID=A0A4R7KVJ0_9CLOT|nr:hypothetical protein EDD71_101221 [Fonticella tunisiensis]
MNLNVVYMKNSHNVVLEVITSLFILTNRLFLKHIYQ